MRENKYIKGNIFHSLSIKFDCKAAWQPSPMINIMWPKYSRKQCGLKGAAWNLEGERNLNPGSTIY